MSISFRKRSTLVPAALLTVFLISLWVFPSARLMIVTVALLFSVSRAFASILAKHREAHLRGGITTVLFVRNVSIETTGLLLAMILAGFLGRYIAQVATRPIASEPAKFAAGIITGLLAGIGVGLLIRRIRGRFIKAPAED